MDEVRGVLIFRAQMYYPADYAQPRAEHHKRRFGKYPEDPKHCLYSAEIIGIIDDLIMQRDRDDLGVPKSLSATLIRDHCAIMGIDLSPEDCEVIITCDKHYRDALATQNMLHREWLAKKKK